MKNFIIFKIIFEKSVVIHYWIDTNAKREQGKKAQLSNIQAAKVYNIYLNNYFI